MELHYSQTTQQRLARPAVFETPMELHYSQTQSCTTVYVHEFETPMELHYSQTSTYESKSTLTAYELPDENALKAAFEA